MNNEIRIKRIILILQIIILLVVVFKSSPPSKNGVILDESPTATQTTSYTKIQGFSEIHFAKDNKMQDFSFTNPKENKCYMDIKLFSFNGEKIFEVKRVEPGYSLTTIELINELDEGLYENCKLIIKCYSMQDGTELNGATMTVNLYVD